MVGATLGGSDGKSVGAPVIGVSVIGATVGVLVVGETVGALDVGESVGALVVGVRVAGSPPSPPTEKLIVSPLALMSYIRIPV